MRNGHRSQSNKIKAQAKEYIGGDGGELVNVNLDESCGGVVLREARARGEGEGRGSGDVEH